VQHEQHNVLQNKNKPITKRMSFRKKLKKWISLKHKIQKTNLIEEKKKKLRVKK
jgi:hypothetical protein